MSCTLDNFPMFVNTQERHKRQRLTLLPTSMEESFVVVGLVQKLFSEGYAALYLSVFNIYATEWDIGFEEIETPKGK